MVLSAFPGRIPAATKYFLIFYPSPNVAPIQLTNIVQILYLRPSFDYLQPVLFIFDLPLKLSVAHIRNKKGIEWQTWNFTNMINCFCCYVIKSAQETAKKVFLSLPSHLKSTAYKINLFQIRILDIKREKVCAVWPYILFVK